MASNPRIRRVGCMLMAGAMLAAVAGSQVWANFSGTLTFIGHIRNLGQANDSVEFFDAVSGGAVTVAKITLQSPDFLGLFSAYDPVTHRYYITRYRFPSSGNRVSAIAAYTGLFTIQLDTDDVRFVPLQWTFNLSLPTGPPPLSDPPRIITASQSGTLPLAYDPITGTIVSSSYSGNADPVAFYNLTSVGSLDPQSGAFTNSVPLTDTLNRPVTINIQASPVVAYNSAQHLSISYLYPAYCSRLRFSKYIRISRRDMWGPTAAIRHVRLWYAGHQHADRESGVRSPPDSHHSLRG
jgi:hypothetical protein